MRHKAAVHGLDWTVASAGTNSYHTGEAPHRYSQKICAVHGIDISDLRATRFTPGDFSQYDRIYAFADDVYRDILRIGGKSSDRSKLDYFLNELNPGCNESVPDPYFGNEDGYRIVYELIDRTCDQIIENYKNKLYV